MAGQKNRYKIMERKMTYTLLADAALFLLYLIFAWAGVVWLKIVIGIVAIVLSGGCLAFLYISQELLKKRSLWMSAAAAAIAVCTLISLVLNYPRPNTYKDIATSTFSANSAIHADL